ncbi:MAG TPA: hypothetical protein VFW16_09305 [Streptosporangiaceae bacterium]|nr:hypothetical protein [Streptosporangiaceae bacterium]
MRPNSGWTILVGLVAVAVVAVVGFRSVPQGPAGSSSTIATLRVVPTLRTVTVSPGTTTFARCHGGKRPLRSTRTALGYPNGRCSIGSRKQKVFPIKITNGKQAKILVRTSFAVPSDGGTEWRPCNLGPHPVFACRGSSGLPGRDQFVMENFSLSAQNPVGLTAQSFRKLSTLTSGCDAEFGPSGDCLASTGQSEREGILLIGPSSSRDNSTTWTVTITWIAMPAGSGG